MAQHRAHSRLAALTTALLSTLAIGGGQADAQPPDPEAVLDHFSCIAPGGLVNPVDQVRLTDQFETNVAAQIFSRPRLCSPAHKRPLGTPAPTPPLPLLHKDAHLQCFFFLPTTVPPAPRVFEVENQFGRATLRVSVASHLCAPSRKFRIGEPAPPPLSEIEDQLDHFRCYDVAQVEAASANPVVVTDQFGEWSLVPNNPEQLCNPAVKEHNGAVTAVKNPSAHLVCYSGATALGPLGVTMESQFGTQAFDPFTFQNRKLCVPSLKREHQHFHAYDVVNPVPAFPREDVLLTDQFGEQFVRPERALELLVPAEKERSGRPPEPSPRPEEHLKCYGITGPELNRTVRVRNQFTESTLLVRQPTRLCTPASKSEEDAPAAPPSDLDHMKCYAVSQERPVFTAETVTLRDQFGEQRVRLGGARFLCTPVQKRREDMELVQVRRPHEHLVCYRFSTRFTPFTRRTVSTRDQFGLQSVTVRTPRMLCVPSEKELVSGG
jgi:hypothetical protein